MTDETGARLVGAKPRRENFRSDDDFGEAYAHWMISKGKTPVAQTPSPLSLIHI